MPTYNFLLSPNPDQAEQIKDLYYAQEWIKEPECPDLIARIIAGSHCFLVASVGDEIVAMGRCISDGVSDAYIQDVAVKKSHRGKGIGTRIINELTARLHKEGMQWIGLIAERGSAGFYNRLGFKKMPDSVPMILGIEDWGLKTED